MKQQGRGPEGLKDPLTLDMSGGLSALQSFPPAAPAVLPHTAPGIVFIVTFPFSAVLPRKWLWGMNKKVKPSSQHRCCTIQSLITPALCCLTPMTAVTISSPCRCSFDIHWSKSISTKIANFLALWLRGLHPGCAQAPKPQSLIPSLTLCSRSIRTSWSCTEEQNTWAGGSCPS